LIEKPEFFSSEHAAAFGFPGVAAAYWTRPLYPAAIIERLLGVLDGDCRAVLDIGCGTGQIARRLAPDVDRGDAVDISEVMLREAAANTGGEGRIRWIHGAVETVELDPPYGLITAGASLHWMDWSEVMPRLKKMLSPRGMLGIVDDYQGSPWRQRLQPLFEKYGTNRNLRLDWDWIGYLEQNGLSKQIGVYRTEPQPYSQSVADYIESFHARESLTRERLGPDLSAEFGAEVRLAVADFERDGMLELHEVGRLVWGLPL
jgi:SAM-dependent methyltransferase